MKSVKSPKQILLSTEYWYKAGEILVSEYKTIFWESKENLETFYTDSPNFVISYVFVLKTVKGLNRIFCVTEYWYKAWKCQICSSNAKPFFWESEADLKTFQKLSFHIGISYKLIPESVKSLSLLLLLIFRIFWYWIFSF